MPAQAETMTVPETLHSEGYRRLPAVIPLSLIEQVKPLAIRDTGELTTGPKGQPNGYRAVIHEYLPLVDAIEEALRQSGLTPKALKYVSVFTQSAEGVRRYWHRDANEGEDSNDILVLCYLQETTEQNGCLIIGKRHNERFREAADHYEVGPIEGERLIPSSLGDLIIIPPHQPHAAARNSTKEVRYLIRLWITLTD